MSIESSKLVVDNVLGQINEIEDGMDDLLSETLKSFEENEMDKHREWNDGMTDFLSETLKSYEKKTKWINTTS